MMRRIGIVGVGQMGSGIAEVCARAGYETLISDVDQPAIDRGIARARASVEKAAGRGKATADDVERVNNLLTGVADLGSLASCDLVIEAAAELPHVKREIFQTLDAVCPPATIFATNTSSLSVIELAASTGRRDRFVGLHFFNPVPVMGLVEVVRSIAVDAAVVGEVSDFARSLGKQVILARDTPGFIVNFLLIPFLLDAIRAVENGIATAEDIDAGFTLGANHPMGPLALSDYIGLDVVFHIAESLYAELRETRYAPPVLLRQQVLAGRLGRKSGAGFFDYQKA